MPEATSAWKGLEERLMRPLVQTAEIGLVAEPPAEPPSVDELLERAAILEYESGLARAETEDLAEDELLE